MIFGRNCKINLFGEHFSTLKIRLKGPLGNNLHHKGVAPLGHYPTIYFLISPLWQANLALIWLPGGIVLIYLTVWQCQILAARANLPQLAENNCPGARNFAVAERQLVLNNCLPRNLAVAGGTVSQGCPPSLFIYTGG